MVCRSGAAADDAGAAQVTIGLDAAKAVAAVLNSLRGLEATIQQNVRAVCEAAAGAVSYTAEGFVPAYRTRRRAENLTGSVVAGTPDAAGSPVTWIRLPQGFVTREDVDSDSGAVPCTVCRWVTVTRCDGPPPLTLDSTRYPAVSNL